MKDIKCKCSHLRSEHKGFFSHCTVCPCSDYIKNNRPTKSEKYMTWLLIGMICLIPIFLISTYYDIEKLKMEGEPVSTEQHWGTVWIFLVGFMTVGSLVMIQSVLRYYDEIKRKTF